ncbi:DUF4164 family protein [Gloeothece verrucosa]|uniref:Uncharacterized protein n=1 Tax=Gloeothece verrucosa (strain PCC 7822) TaxID=497965 RepID=E0U930_GLOV7|nr:DUF4164 family protein [Gloeothece verrucosa]ADN16169.1 conserved hypothetical protein [Gloeothece verrucosa PCC 7822]
MSESPVTVTYSLENILTRVEEKIERQFEDVNRKIDKFEERIHEKIDRIDDRLNEKIDRFDQNINEKIDKLDERLNEKIERFDQRLNNLEIGQAEIKGDIKALDEKIQGLSKRLETQEWINRGLLITLIVVILGGLALGFRWVSNP